MWGILRVLRGNNCHSTEPLLGTRRVPSSSHVSSHLILTATLGSSLSSSFTSEETKAQSIEGTCPGSLGALKAPVPGSNRGCLSPWLTQWPPRVSLGSVFRILLLRPETSSLLSYLAPGPLLGAGYRDAVFPKDVLHPTFICQASLRRGSSARGGGSEGAWRPTGGAGGEHLGGGTGKQEREGRGGRGSQKRAGPQVGLGFAEAMGHWPGTCRSLVSTGWVLRSPPSPRAASCVLPAQQAGSGRHRVSSFL